MLPNANNHLFCFGIGYVGSALAESLLQNGWSVSGTVRTEENCRTLESKGFEVFCDNGVITEPMLKALSQASHILVSVPPTKDGDVIFDSYHATLSTLSSVRWLGYLSSTVVYGDAEGAWVDEETPTNPNNPRGMRRVEAERQWAGSGFDCHIFRISGIYGPERNPLLKVKSGSAKPVIKDNHVFCRIHIDDIVATLMASMKNPKAGSIYNLADDEPAASHDVISYAAQLLNITQPIALPIEEAGLSPMALSFYDGCRRIKNEKIKQELGVKLKYQSYRQGLKSLVKDI